MQNQTFAQLAGQLFCPAPAALATGGIGTLAEKPLHRLLKAYYLPPEGRTEAPLGRHVVDILSPAGAVEIQTSGLYPLRKKLPALLALLPVTVVYPVAHEKRIHWVDPGSGALSGGRKSPKTGTGADALRQLFWLRDWIGHPGLTICLPMVDLEEYRLLDGWGNGGKRGSHRLCQIPVDLWDELVLRTPADLLQLLPAGLPATFTRAQLQRAARLSPRAAGDGLRLLTGLGVVQPAGRQGKSLLYCVPPRQ